MQHSRVIYLFFFLLFNADAYSQVMQPADTIPELSLEELLRLNALDSSTVTEAELNARIEAASQRPFSTRETPNIVTVITADEIRNSGARDLIDVLRLVPGIEFGIDVEGVISIGMRGQWAAEGKMLVTVDGVEMNEIMYGFYTFSNDFSITAIKRVEVVRGPGAVINGGFAVLGVINIITYDVNDKKGVSVSSSVGSTQSGFSRSTAEFSLNSHSNDDWHLGIRGGFGNSIFSDQQYTDIYGDSYNMRLGTDIRRRDAMATISGHGLNIILMYRQHSITSQAPYDTAYSNYKYTSHFNLFRASINYTRKFASGWSFGTGINLNTDRPWRATSDIPYFELYDRTGKRTRFTSNIGYSFSRNLSLNFGLQAIVDQGKSNNDTIKFNTTDSIYFSIKNQSFYSEVTWKTYWFNIIAGFRSEFNSAYGSVFLPRLALTRNFERFSFKLLATESFKAPTLEHIDLDDELNPIKPELVIVGELEIGYKINRNAYVNANIFGIDIKNTIQVVFDDVTGDEYYFNGDRQVNYGAEAEFIWRDAVNQFRASWSYYTINSAFLSELNAVPDNDNVLLNFPQHKLVLMATRKLSSAWVVNFSGQLMSERFLSNGFDAQGEYIVIRYKPDALLSGTINKKNVVPGLDLSVSVHNLLNRRFVIGQTYYAGLTSISTLSREFVLRLTWHPDLNK
jgi:outer membrane receptor for ferrienterochelin and colicin